MLAEQGEGTSSHNFCWPSSKRKLELSSGRRHQTEWVYFVSALIIGLAFVNEIEGNLVFLTHGEKCFAQKLNKNSPSNFARSNFWNTKTASYYFYTLQTKFLPTRPFLELLRLLFWRWMLSSIFMGNWFFHVGIYTIEFQDWTHHGWWQNRLPH